MKFRIEWSEDHRQWRLMTPPLCPKLNSAWVPQFYSKYKIVLRIEARIMRANESAKLEREDTHKTEEFEL